MTNSHCGKPAVGFARIITNTSAIEVSKLPTGEAIAAIRLGLPVAAIEECAKLLGVPERILIAKLDLPIRRRDRLSSYETEKLVRAAKIYAIARTLFTSDEAIHRWISSPLIALDGQAPIDLLDTGIGARDVEAVLLGIAYANVM